ncbi:hypothetical protein SCAR479_12712 [Seiridium cardinale]|uniref:DH domain-containing protein n=1 Tax=Seiridium cardinale TaxID=138064 RepID=A0ABR2XAI1_9PEZI
MSQGDVQATRPFPEMEAGNRHEEDRLVGRAHHLDPQSQPHFDDENLLLRPHSPYSDFDPSPAFAERPPYGHRNSTGAEAVPLHLQHQHSAALATYAANNHHAANANASLDGIADPDDFYRTYRATTLPTPNSSSRTDYDELMASTSTLSPAQRQNQNASSLRSNGNGTTPKHPAVPTTTRTGLRPTSRSVSMPITEDSGGVAKLRPAAHSSSQPSVKDLKKRFDQNTAAQASNSSNTAAVRKAAPRAMSRDPSSSPASYRGVGGTHGSIPYSTARSQSTAGSTSAARLSQRSKFSAEDQVSNNSQSFASRIAKPRASNGLSSKSMSNLSPTSPASAQSIPPVPQLDKNLAKGTDRGLLFGEILPGENEIGLAGYGIEGIRPRRTSESNLPSVAALHQRSISHADAEPASPTDWYRNNNARREGSRSPTKLYKSHNRSQSDLAGTKPPLTQLRTPLSSRKQSIPTSDLTPSAGTSKLPVSIRKNSPSSASPPFSRSNTPSTLKRPSSRLQGKIPKPTPISTSSGRAKTPTSGPTGKRPPGTLTPNGNTRLNAYISAPPPKLSPPLRSSRPRQPVSAASTASSRMRAAERGRSPAKGDSRMGRQNEPQRRRKLSMGPIDFNARREQIKLSYTKSIKETEAKAAAKRQAAIENEKRRRAEEEEEEEAARLDAERRQQEEAQEALEKGKQDAADLTLGVEKPVAENVPSEQPPEQQTFTLGKHVPESLAPPESFAPGTALDATHVSLDSPTLGIPGSFPSLGSPDLQERAPPSASSDTTEFDAEPQTEPPFHQAPIPAPSGYDEIHESAGLTHAVSEYKSPFDLSPHDDTASIKISLDPTSTVPETTTPLDDDADTPEDTSRPYQEDEYVPQPYVAPTYETTVTIIGRNSDFISKASEDEAPSSCDDQPEKTGQEDDHSPQDHDPVPHQETVSGDEFSDQDTPLKKLEEFYIGPNVAESAARLRSSGASKTSARHTRTWSMEQNDHASSDAPRFSAETRRTLETRPSLTVPRASTSANRASQNTVWTDYSIDSRDEYPEYSVKLHRRDSAYRESDSVSDVGSRAQRGSGFYPSSPETSPHGSYRSPHSMHGTQHQGSAHQLPELDTGGGFVVDYITRKNSTPFIVPVLPDHSPPPPPEEATFPDLSSAAPSEYFDDTRPSSYLHGTQDGYSAFSVSRPQSESYDMPGSTPHSIDHGSLEISEGQASTRTRMDSQTTLADSIEQQENSTGLSAKERKRLFTRLETLKELVDTEAFFVRDMSIVEEIYKGTAEACPKLDDKIIKLIFRNTDQIITFHTAFLAELKDGVSSVYIPKVSRSIVPKDTSSQTDGTAGSSPAMGQLDDGKDRDTSLGPVFKRNMENMKSVHETFLKNSDHAAKQLIEIQEDPTVKVWLNECNEVARDLTKAWNLDSLLIKPMQRITKYPNLLIQLLHETPPDHPDRAALESAKASLEDAIEEINKTKKNFELVGQIVGRKRKDSNVGGFARAFGKRVDKLQAANNRPVEDADYMKLHEKFGDDYLRLQVVLRDVEFYTRQVSAYVHEFLQYLSSMELVMRLQPSPHPELESKWVRFNVSMRDIEKVALEQHLSQVRKQVIEPFESVIKAYSNPSLAMKKRAKRRADYEKAAQLKKSGKKLDKQLTECVEQYEALNDALKKELPKLSALTEKVGNICLGNLVNIQTQWYSIWKEKVKVVLENPQIPEISDIVSAFQRDYKFQEEHINSMSILNPGSKPRPSQSSIDDQSLRLRPRPSDLSSLRARGLSVNSEVAPSLPTPDFVKRHSGQFTVSPSVASIPSPHQFYYRDYYAGIGSNTPAGSLTPNSTDPSAAVRPPASGPLRPGTGQSYDSSGAPRQSTDSSAQTTRYSNSVYHSGYQSPPEPVQNQRFSGLFNSALPLSDAPERSTRQSRASSRASSRERQPINGYNVMWLAASLFEFNIETTKVEAGYPYLTYQAGEIFDVIAEKGELWLAKNQDDPNNLVGWLWSKHFAKLADD